MSLAVQSTYIHYIYNNFDGSGYNYHADIGRIKQEILTRFLSNARKNITGSVDDKTLIRLLKEISGGGQIGARLMDELNAQNWQECWEPSGAPKSLMQTGNAETIKIPSEAEDLVRDVQIALNGIVQAMGQAEQYIVIKEMSKMLDGTPVSVAMPNVKADGVFSVPQISLADVECVTAMTKLKENLILLQNNGGTILGQETLESIMRSIRGCFNTLGGRLYEVVPMHALNIIGKQMEDQIQSTNRQINQLSGLVAYQNFRSQATGSGKIAGSDIKPDISLIYNENGVIYRFGGSVKLAQNRDTIKGEQPKIKNLHSGLTLGQMFQDYFSIIGDSLNNLEWFEAGLGALRIYSSANSTIPFNQNNSSGAYSTLSSSWDNLKEASKYAGFLRALTGSGAISGNLGSLFADNAAFMVVNNKVYSMYSILEQIANNFDKYASISGAGWGNASSFSAWHKKILASQQKKALDGGPDYAETRSQAISQYIQELYNTSIKIDLNFAGLNF